jgi:hypothetical protein
MDGRVMVLEVPYQDGLTIPAYLVLPPSSKRLGGAGTNGTPVVVNFGGPVPRRKSSITPLPLLGLT